MEITGILHCHSNYSYDAKLPLADLRERCIARGIRFVCMTEHTDELTKERAMAFVAECASYSDDRFHFIPGFEVPYKHAHVLMIGMRSFYDVYAPTIEVLQRWTKEAAFVVLAHPVRNAFVVDPGLLEEIDALEVWNQQYEGKRVPRIRSLKLYELLREQKPTLVATGGVDLHRAEHFGAPLVTLSVESLDEVAILDALKRGAFTVMSPQTSFRGTESNIQALIAKHRWESHLSVSVIVCGKFVNKVLAQLGLKLPKRLAQTVRRRL